MSYEVVEINKSLRLVQLLPDQADDLFNLTDNNREYLGKYLPWVQQVRGIEDSRKHIEETLENRAGNASYTYGIELNNQIVGDISLRNLKDESRPPEIGYWIAPEHSGKGLTTRAVHALTALGLNALCLDRILIKANADNIASNKVAEKAGYSLIDIEEDNDETFNIWSVENP